MKKSNGINKKNIAVFISGRGSNLKSLIKYSKLKKSRFNVKLVITNKKNAKGLNYAKKNKIVYFIVNYKICNFIFFCIVKTICFFFICNN